MRTLIYLALLAILASSCEEIIAKDITGQLPVFIIPTQNDTVQVNPVHFKWAEMEGATSYHLMVVSPSFSSIQSYVLDSLVTDTDFYFQLDSNEYELKLVALNAGYSSDTLGPIKFWVGVQSSSSGGSGSLLLTAPSNGVYVNATFNKQFLWNTYSGATSHEISIRQGADFATGTIIDFQNNNMTGIHNSTVEFPEGEYHWGVKAYYLGGNTGFTTQVFYVDTIAPNDPVLFTPVDFGFENIGNITFTWISGTDQGVIQSPVNSIVEIATDPAFTSGYQSVSIQGSTTLVNLANGIYYWRVTNLDDAGNYSYTSLHNQFTVN
ncbi:MAG: hypothetical protein QNK23_16820 [Crocinitomicaceae bacterium]|nr:hypothetical protein [Crocinitomicaceae bacterium]